MPDVATSVTRWAHNRRVRSAAAWIVVVGTFYLVEQMLWPAPIGVVVHGVEIGGLIALIALGLMLVYRADKIINFSQATLGLPAATLGFLLMTRGWSFWPAFVVALVIGTLTGLLAQVLVMRFFFRAPRLVATVVTIGIAQILVGVAGLLPNWLAGAQVLTISTNAVPFNLNFRIDPVFFNGTDVLAIIAVPVMILSLFAFMRYTHIGVAIRASADNADRASLLGVNVMSLKIIVWAAAGLLATVGVFLQTGVEGTAVGGQTDSADLLVQILAAAVIARMERFGTMVAAAAALGILEQAIVWHTGSAELVAPVTFIVIVGALLFQRRGRSTRQQLEPSSSWNAIGNVRPTPAVLARLPEVARARWAVIASVAAVALAVPWIFGPGDTNLASVVLIYAILATSLVVLTGWAGQISLGQFGFMGIGAGIGAAIGWYWNWDLVWIVLLSGLAGAVGAMVIGIPALRIKGVLLAVTTLSFSVVVGSFLLNPDEVSWLPGVSDFLQRPGALGRGVYSERSYYYVCLVFLSLTLLALSGLRRSRTGRVLMAVRDNPAAAESYGVNQTRAKLTAFAISGFIAAAAGALYVFSQQSLDASQFTPDASLGAFTMVVVGGLGSLTGGILGAIFVNGIVWFQNLFPTVVRPGINALGTGAGLILILCLLPNGLATVPFRIRDNFLRRVATEHELSVEALMSDTPTGTDALKNRRRRVGQGIRTRHQASRIRKARSKTAIAGAPLLDVSNLEVGYDGVQVLFGVDATVNSGEVVALLGTNGAGKSTLLKAISGIQTPAGGRVVFEGRNLAGIPPHKVVSLGLVQMPGGRGVFHSLTVSENLRIAGWLARHDRHVLAARMQEALTKFPVLRTHLDKPAVNLSGGEQQILMLAQTLMLAPRLVLIDELSLGLAPIVVESLMQTVKEMRDSGITFVLVEQSVNVALTVSDRAYFMEKGEVRFEGDCGELLDRPDIMRSIFFAGAVHQATGPLPTEPVPTVARPSTPVQTNVKAPADEGRAVLELHGVSRSYGGIAAVDNVSFDLHEHEILGIIGPNGAGKTTLFDLIGGSTSLGSGQIILDGKDVTKLGPDARARMGLGRSFQDARLFPGLTVGQTIAVALERRTSERDPVAAALHLPEVAESEAMVESEVEDLLERLALGPFRDKFISELSTGTRRVVDLACTLAHGPSVLLLDEPSSGLAQRESERLGPFIQRIRDEIGCAILLIEHDMPLISSVADRLIAMELGTILTQGKPDAVLDDDGVIACYLGTSPEAFARSGAIGTREVSPA